MEDIVVDKTTLCPSARPESWDSVVFGVVVGTVTEPRVAYLKKPQPITDELIAKASPITPAEIFRMAAPCATKGCQHFDGQDCRLAMRIVEKLPVVAEELSPCSIRRNCRWWQQEGRAACMRCPQVITDNYNASELAVKVAAPISD
ncbi:MULTISPECIES: nitrogen fixation protein [unclassified Nostoc]|uniref:nitrogen fixation protein n=1 Tax=unclassified Nostoc TaxID=2593658 RepID=UPI0025AB4F51|nr:MULTISPECIES: nitrogen fixation protein [unclassified Nostoc]MDM9585300.1 nitrogen fixation protein [Nostoc sp. GT001]MDZ7945305.1 nitrogen fixation protein [Nostoc sp. EfeVER01]MDZ7993484.1 nitrogen fixation protein [Nostoc sp. EspVER01]